MDPMETVGPNQNPGQIDISCGAAPTVNAMARMPSARPNSIPAARVRSGALIQSFISSSGAMR